MGHILFTINQRDIIRIEGKGSIQILEEEINNDPILFAAMRDWYHSFGTEVLGRKYNLTIEPDPIKDPTITFCIEGEKNDTPDLQHEHQIQVPRPVRLD